MHHEDYEQLMVEEPPERPSADNRRPLADQYRELEGRTTWTYLAFLAALFLGLVLISWACNDEPETAVDLMTVPGDAEADMPLDEVFIDVLIDNDVITISGSVPDEAARRQMVDEAGLLYGPENVVDQLTVDEATTFEGGLVRMAGRSMAGDDRALLLQDALAGLGLSRGQFAVDSVAADITPVAITAVATGDTLTLSGVVPDSASIGSLIAAGEAAWAPGVVDGSGLTEGSTTWTDGRVTVEGTIPPGDGRLEALVAGIRAGFGPEVNVDVSAVGADAAAVESLEAEILADLQANPILFAPLSAEIEATSDATLLGLVERLNAVPEVQIEVVGHTDALGPAEENLVLSQQRAQAVVDRLVELGIAADRLRSRGEGETQPLVEGDSEEANAQNRRIEFLLFVGTGGN